MAGAAQSPATLRTAAPPQRRWRYFVAPTVLAVALVVADGSRHRTCPPAEGFGLSQPVSHAAASSARLRIASFNIHGCRDSASRYDFDRTARQLRGFDLVGLNEVYGGWPWQTGQAQQLGHALDMPWLFAPTTRRWWRDDFGNGLLSRLPVSHWQRVPLEGTRSKGHRNYVLAEMRCAQTTVHVLVTHLDSVQDSQLQLQQVAPVFLSLPEPALLMGDLNTRADAPLLARLLATPGVVDLVAAGHSPDLPNRIDWILGRGLRAIDGGAVDTGASDHPLVWAEVEVSPEPRVQSLEPGVVD